MDPFILLLINMLLLVIVIIFIAIYLVKRENSYREQLLDKMDRLIELMEGRCIKD